MFTSVEAAVQTLEDAGAITYTISQAPNLKLTADAGSTQELLDKFLTDWEKLAPSIYRVDYSKTIADKRSGLCFRVSKTAPASGSPERLAGIGGPNDLISGLQQQVWNLQKDAELRDLQRQHSEELRRLKEENGGGDGLGVLGPLIGKIPEIQNILYMATGRKPLSLPAAVAGPAPTAAPAGDPAAEQALAVALETLEGALGGPLLVDTLQKLASKDPAKLRQVVGMIDML